MTSETKFTPGPWEVAGSTVYALNGDGANRFDCLVEGGYVSTRVAPGVKTPSCELAANAHLIAAAPALYNKLVKFRDWMNRQADHHEKMAVSYKGRFDHLAGECKADARNYRATAKDIDAALAKARGEAPNA